MVTFQCSRCKGTCQANPSHTSRLHTCEYCGLILTIPGKPVRRPAQKQTKLGLAEVLIGSAAIVALLALGLVVSSLGNRPAQAARPTHAEVTRQPAVQVTVVEESARPVTVQRSQPAQEPAGSTAAQAKVKPSPAPVEAVVVIEEPM